jgi:2-methylisocitrate lyase-like PEP mutase family enzyme
MASLDKVASFRALHAGERVLVLANAWDAASAALFVTLGARAAATTSAGLAWACGFADGDALPRQRLLDAIASICRVASGVPVTADIESGYSTEPDAVAELVAELRALGVAGINLEDGTGSPELLVAKIVGIKRKLASAGRDIFINARTDVYLRGFAQGERAVHEVIARAHAYELAGADGIFVPELSDPAAIRSIVRAVALPLNLMAVPGLAPLPELHALGVRRLSAGAAIAKASYGAARRIAGAFLRDGNCDALFAEDGIDYGETNALLETLGAAAT